MSQTFELEDIRRLDIREGETLAVTLPPQAIPQDAARTREVLQELLPGVKVLVVSHGVELQVLCPSDPASPAAD